MYVPGGNHVDRQRKLAPRDYAQSPARFGSDPDLTFRVPEGGDRESALIARWQHALVVRWRQQGNRPSGAALGRRFGFSKQTMSESAVGKRWAGQAVTTALLAAAREHAQR